MKVLQSVCLFCLLLVASPASAAVFKCVDAKGKVSFQEEPCPETTKGTEVAVKGVQAALSPEDQMWVNDRKSMLTALCVDALNASQKRALLTTSERTEVCDCGTQKLFKEPVAKLRKLESTNNSTGMIELMKPISTSCARELLARRKR